jgi:hypothetical protein
VTYLDQLKAVADNHVARVRGAYPHYGDSCLKRGGVGLFMMLARKWDRIERRVDKPITQIKMFNEGQPQPQPYDILEHIKADTRPEGVADDVADLIDYLMIVEAELRHRGEWPGDTEQHNNGFSRPDVSHPFGYESDEACPHCEGKGCTYCGA